MTTALALELPWRPWREGEGRGGAGEGLGAQERNGKLEKGSFNWEHYRE